MSHVWGQVNRFFSWGALRVELLRVLGRYKVIRLPMHEESRALYVLNVLDIVEMFGNQPRSDKRIVDPSDLFNGCVGWHKRQEARLAGSGHSDRRPCAYGTSEYDYITFLNACLLNDVLVNVISISFDLGSRASIRVFIDPITGVLHCEYVNI